MERNQVDIFSKDVEVPAIVQEKADEAFAKIRQQETGKLGKNTYKGNNVKRFIRPLAAVAACAVAVAVIGVSVRTGTEDLYNEGDTNNVAQNSNPFVIMAYAQELNGSNDVPIDVGMQRTFSLDGNFKTGKVVYNIETNFSCMGDNIDTITYSINNAAFDICELEDDSVIIDEIAYDETDITPEGAGIVDDDGSTISVSRLLKEYTVRYDAQTNDTTIISIAGIKYSLDIVNAIWGDEYNGEAVAAAYDELLEEVEITCTVHYTDGTHASRVITMGGKVRTSEGDVSNNGENANTKAAFFVFKLKDVE